MTQQQLNLIRLLSQSLDLQLESVSASEEAAKQIQELAASVGVRIKQETKSRQWVACGKDLGRYSNWMAFVLIQKLVF